MHPPQASWNTHHGVSNQNFYALSQNLHKNKCVYKTQLTKAQSKKIIILGYCIKKGIIGIKGIIILLLE